LYFSGVDVIALGKFGIAVLSCCHLLIKGDGTRINTSIIRRRDTEEIIEDIEDVTSVKKLLIAND
jgi:hypothetical protein